MWCLYYAWIGTVPKTWEPGGNAEAGKPMRASTRYIYAVGGVFLTALGMILFFWP